VTSSSWACSSSSPAETEAAGARLAESLRPGDVVLVSGELGAGKTTFVRGAARALRVTAPVTSPTFTIGQVYAGEPDVAHLDLFRLEGQEPGLLDDYLTPDRVAFMEWPDVAEPELDHVTARVRIEHGGGDERRIEVETA
jgi:tRNA threonylcarbamoyladenosine biosynthesis protein TsaE